ncbi:uncharacterized protein MELLADRAFT_93078 [Melampsora larici-populina 98AG31]|uniref:Uncharacterized protein n=1 Tax=Melampsora larici-populina (strain 98AG31 / pathotype 3-4-7) TaxID=747676 RepID=F4S3V4_MELLP|nr:uncharacterized protein MELLADRAFT_93078 [Melampsora larici-populina 98AG31]EGG00677.1 hypothetical protein MELLADRAFT_93078 [Melampsora larici-populina 98AG31]
MQNRTEPNVFQQPQTQPTSFAQMSICSTRDQPNHDGPSQTEPNVFQRPPSQPTSLSRMSICSTRDQPDHDGPSQTKLNVFQQPQTQPTSFARMSICSTRDQPDHDGPASQTELNVFQQPQTQPTSLFRMSICSTQNQPNQQPTHRQSVHSTQNQPNQQPTHRQSVHSTQNRPNQRPTHRQSVQSQRISASAANAHQSNSNSITHAATSPHEEDSAPPSSHGADSDDVQEDDQDTPESDFDGVFDLGEHRKYENRGASRRARKTTARHDGTRYEKLAKDPVECSQYERLTIAMHHYHNLLLGIVRKRKGQKGNRLLPLPPSDDEYSAWDKRKTERRHIVDKSVKKARNRYLRKHPKALPAQLAKVADHAAEDAISTIPPVKFTSLVALRNSGVLYSTTVVSICEGALALSGFARFTYDWTDTIKSKWNEAVSCIIIQEWEKCYKRGDADDYDIDSTQVTPKNLRQVIDRWFKTKAREFSNQSGDQTQEDDENQALLQEAAKEKTRRRESRKRRIFPEHRSLQALLSERSIHSEDEVDSTGHAYRKPKLWRHKDLNEFRKPKLWRHKDLNEFLHELDALYIKEQQTDQAITSANYLARPPKGFPKALLDQDFINQHVSRVAVLGLELSAHKYDLRPLIERTKWLQLPEASYVATLGVGIKSECQCTVSSGFFSNNKTASGTLQELPNQPHIHYSRTFQKTNSNHHSLFFVPTSCSLFLDHFPSSQSYSPSANFQDTLPLRHTTTITSRTVAAIAFMFPLDMRSLPVSHSSPPLYLGFLQVIRFRSTRSYFKNCATKARSWLALAARRFQANRETPGQLFSSSPPPASVASSGPPQSPAVLPCTTPSSPITSPDPALSALIIPTTSEPPSPMSIDPASFALMPPHYGDPNTLFTLPSTSSSSTRTSPMSIDPPSIIESFQHSTGSTSSRTVSSRRSACYFTIEQLLDLEIHRLSPTPSSSRQPRPPSATDVSPPDLATHLAARIPRPYAHSPCPDVSLPPSPPFDYAPVKRSCSLSVVDESHAQPYKRNKRHMSEGLPPQPLALDVRKRRFSVLLEDGQHVQPYKRYKISSRVPLYAADAFPLTSSSRYQHGWCVDSNKTPEFWTSCQKTIQES